MTCRSTYLIVSLFIVSSGAEVESKNKEKTNQLTDEEETIPSSDYKTTLEITDDPDEFIIEDVD